MRFYGMRETAIAFGLAAVLAAGACSAHPPASGPAAHRQIAVAASRQTPAEAEATLASLRRVDDLPLYEMTYQGDYDPLAGRATAPTPSPFGCSLFVASGDPARPLFARNFDWDAHPALVLHTDPPDGYASVSIVDISYLGVGADPRGDRRLLDAPLLPFDGMNERGLAVGLAADASGRARVDAARPTVGGVRILRLVLDRAATLAEALAVFGRYNVDFDGGPPLHYLLADATGASAVVEFVDGDMRVLPGAAPGQALTNIRLAGLDEALRRRDHRYAVASAALGAAGGVLDWRQAMQILRDVAQAHTRWSVTYDLRTGEVHVVTGKRWARVHPFDLPVHPPTG